MKTTATFTSTISPALIAWVDSRAKEEKKTRRCVLEDALRSYQRESVKKVLAEGFSRAAADAEVVELAEWGMGDYSHTIGRA